MKYNSEYHSEETLTEIENWRILNVYQLIERLKELWQYKDCISIKYTKDLLFGKNPTILLRLNTGGWSGNEDIIEALQNNTMFWTVCWVSSERGGRYTFEIELSRIGFLSITEFCKLNHVSKQYIYQNKDKYDYIKIPNNKGLIRNKVK